MVHGVVHILAYFHETFAAAGELMVEGMRQPREFLLWDQVMGGVAHMPDGAVIKVIPHHASGAESTRLLEDFELIGKALLHFIPLGIPIGSLCAGTCLGAFLGNVHHVSDPGG